jgi:hypothetical protein
MKMNLKSLAIMMSIAILAFFVGCSDDDDTTVADNDDIDTIIDDIVESGPTLSDGIYIVGAAISTDTTVANSLEAGLVGAPDFGSQSRDGMYEGLVYMQTGSFSFIKVEGETITAMGGAWADAYDRDSLAIYKGSLEAGGTGDSPLNQGGTLAHVMVDETTSQYVITPIDNWEIIGDATPGGWDSGTEIGQTSASVTGVIFEATNVTLRSGYFKFRMNDTWGINLETGECDAAAEACLSYFTNLGGTTISDLVSGGANISQEEEGVYTVSLTYAPGAGLSVVASVVKIGDAEEITFDPENFKWGVIGDASAGGWDSDRDLFYKGLDTEKGHYWAGIAYLGAEGAFKFRANDGWDLSLGGALTVDGVATVLVKGGDNITPPANPGAYYFEVATTDEGDTWSAIMTPSSWGVIGVATAGGWDADTDMTANGFVDGVTTYSIQGTFTEGEWKFRANDDWAINMGGSLDSLKLDGSNLAFAAGGTYTITMKISLDANGNTVYTAEVMGESDEITFDPENFKWGVIGDASAGGWDSDRDLFYKGLDTEKGHYWAGIAYLGAEGAFKFRANDGWDLSLGGALTVDGVATVLVKGGDNITPPPIPGAYYFEVFTTDEGATWSATMTSSSWGIIGENLEGGWDTDTDMTAGGFADGVTTYSVEGVLPAGPWKFRANDDWAINMGGSLDSLVLNGDNMELEAAVALTTITMKISLDANGNTIYTAEVNY